MLCRPAGSSARARPAGHLTYSHLTRQVLPLVLLYELAQVGDALDLRREGGGPLSSTAHAFTINRHARIHRHTIAKALHKDNPAAQRRSVQRAWARMVRVVRTHQRAAGLDEGGWLPARRRAEAPDPLEVGGREGGRLDRPRCPCACPCASERASTHSAAAVAPHKPYAHANVAAHTLRAALLLPSMPPANQPAPRPGSGTPAPTPRPCLTCRAAGVRVAALHPSYCCYMVDFE